MRVLFLAAEAAPLVKVGGLGDVAGELPRALSRLGVDVRLAIPRYPHLAQQTRGRSPQTVVEVPSLVGSLRAAVHETENQGVRTWLIGGEPIERVPSIYGPTPADAAKFIFFVLGALQACRAVKWQPDLVHANDWHTAPALAWMRTAEPGWGPTGTLLTIHNLSYMGAGGEATLQEYGFAAADHPLLPDWARFLPLPVGMLHADALTAVSPGYAAEIQTAGFGCGLESFLTSRAGTLRGILNGIDTEAWDPATDRSLVSRFDRRSVARRAPNKADLQRAVGLPVEARMPLLAMISRLEMQKGVDLLMEAVEGLAVRPWQLILLGTGDPGLEDRARAFAGRHPERVRFLPTFDLELARRIYAGTDVLLVPSRFEPCGLVQMIGMRFGAVPIVRSTGGLKDTVSPYSPEGKGTGFLFGPAEPGALADTIREAIGVFEDRPAWRALQERGMSQDFSWDRSAQAYADLYREVVTLRRCAVGGAQ